MIIYLNQMHSSYNMHHIASFHIILLHHITPIIYCILYICILYAIIYCTMSYSIISFFVSFVVSVIVCLFVYLFVSFFLSKQIDWEQRRQLVDLWTSECPYVAMGIPRHPQVQRQTLTPVVEFCPEQTMGSNQRPIPHLHLP